jgi:hypothetical protein
VSSLVVNPGWLAVLKAAIATAGALLLLSSYVAHRAGRLPRARKHRDALLLGLGIAAGLCWWNLGDFRARGYVHLWDTYHYYVGAKYFHEVGYERLYVCAAVADHEDGQLGVDPGRRIRDLASNRLAPISSTLRDPGQCRRHFSPERWTAFKHDLAWFRGGMAPRDWAAAQGDHGYNGSPAWRVAGSLLASTAPASTAQILALTLIDPLLLLLMWVGVAWAFGWRVMCVALIYWGTNVPGEFSWQGGAYLRQDWLAASILGICLLRRGWMGLGGAALTWAPLLRVFPGLLLAGLILKAIAEAVPPRRWTWSREGRRLVAGVLLALVASLSLSALAAGGPGAWREFAANSIKHAATPLTNHMGLRTVIAFEPSTRASRSAPLGLEADPFAVWKDARHRVFAERRWIWILLVVGFAALVALAARGRPPWVAAVLGVGLVPVGVELTCYYYSLLLAYALLWREDDLTGAGLAALSALTGVISALTTWNDVRYTAMSVVVVIFVVIVTAYYAWRAPRLY